MSNSTHLNRIDDLAIRLVGIPGFGILIPNFTGLFGDLGPKDALYWFGYLYFIFIAWCIWQGNRWLLFKQRENMDWFSNPIRKLLMLVAANVFFTAPVTVALITGWYQIASFAIDWNVVQLVTLANVICVIFVTHAYETVFLIKERQSDRLNFEQLERARVESELELLKSQLDPHFMFNSLNTLAYLIEHDQSKALLFNESLSDIYRYILMNKKQELVSLKDELAFVNSYFALIRIRFGVGVSLTVDVKKQDEHRLLAPISLQMLLENAVKHNEFDESNPLTIEISCSDQWVEVKNNLQVKPANISSKIGLRNLTERYKLLTGREVLVQKENGFFNVKLPYLAA